MHTFQNLILTDLQLLQKIRRIAYQIYENNFDETSIVFAGIEPNGNHLAHLLLAEFKQITSMEVFYTSIKKSTSPQQAGIHYEIACDKQLVENKVVVVIDDVLHTGKTLIYGLNPLLASAVKKIQTVVLVKREHHQFPVHVDYVGYALSTTILQHVHVELLKQEEMGVYLY